MSEPYPVYPPQPFQGTVDPAPDDRAVSEAPRPPLAFSVRIKRPWVEEDVVWPRSTYGVDQAGVLFVFHDDGTNHAYSPSRWAEANTELPEDVA